MRVRIPIAVVTVLGAAVASASELQHPVIAPIDGFVLRPAAQSKVSDFNEFRFRRKDAQGREEFFVKKGRFWDLNYHKPAVGGGDARSFLSRDIHFPAVGGHPVSRTSPGVSRSWQVRGVQREASGWAQHLRRRGGAPEPEMLPGC